MKSNVHNIIQSTQYIKIYNFGFSSSNRPVTDPTNTWCGKCVAINKVHILTAISTIWNYTHTKMHSLCLVGSWDLNISKITCQIPAPGHIRSTVKMS